MWLMPSDWTSATVASARSWLMEPSAAAPKMTRVDWWPVLPKSRVGSMLEEYLAGEMPFAQHSFQDLSGPGLRQRLLRDLDHLRHFVPGDQAATVLPQLLTAGDGVRVQHDDGVHCLTPGLVGYPEHGRLGDCGMTVERVLHLDRIDVLRSGDDHVLGSIDDEEVVPFVEVAEVAGVVPATAQRTSGRLRVSPVADGHGVGSGEHLPDLADLTIGVIGAHDPHGDADRRLTTGPCKWSVQRVLFVAHPGDDRRRL